MEDVPEEVQPEEQPMGEEPEEPAVSPGQGLQPGQAPDEDPIPQPEVPTEPAPEEPMEPAPEG